jgi:hypothetical protein
MIISKKMDPEKLKIQRIAQAELNLEMAEKIVDNWDQDSGASSDTNPDYLGDICSSIYHEQIYDQIINYYQQKISLTKDEAIKRLNQRMRKKYFQIRLVNAEIDLLLSDLRKRDMDPHERLKISKEVVRLTMMRGEMTRQANAFEFRSFESIEKIEQKDTNSHENE